MSGDDAQVTAVRRRLRRQVDPCALYATLTEGHRRDTALFECQDGATLLMASAAVRIECRGNTVTFIALTANGRSLIGDAGKRLAEHCVHASPDRLIARYPRNLDHDPGQSLVAAAPLHALRTITGLLPPGGDAFEPAVLGIVAFDYAGQAEGLDASGQADPFDFPDFIFWVPESLVLFDGHAPPQILCTAFGQADSGEGQCNFHDAVERLAKLTDRCETSFALRQPPRIQKPSEEPAAVDIDDRRFRELVGRLKDEIAAGEVYQIVPSRTFSRPCDDPLDAFGQLRSLEPSPYRYFIDAGEWTLFGASPETSVRTARKASQLGIEVRPIAGTRPRGASADEDDRLEAGLKLDAKELAEHMMLVDLARNDVARVSRPGTRRVERLLDIKRHARVMHLESVVSGTLRDGFDSLNALAACLNVGTLVGAPKIRATELLLRVEATRRGPYGGAVGWLNGAGEMNTAVIIRSALVQAGMAYVRAGAGIVHDSDPQAECDETRHKASMILSVLQSAELVA